MQNYTTSTRPIEEAYFHTGNSGITARVIETIRQYETEEERDIRLEYEEWSKLPPAERGIGRITGCSGDRYFNYKMEFIHGAMGHSSTMSTPVMSPDMIDIYIEMLTRVKDRMTSHEDYRPEHTINPSDRRRVVTMKNGLTLEEVWSPEIIVSQWSTSSMFLGHNLVDAGIVVGFEPYKGKPIERGSSGEGGSPYYHYEDIGKPVDEARPFEVDITTATKRSCKGNRRVFYVDVDSLMSDTAEDAIRNFMAKAKAIKPLD